MKQQVERKFQKERKTNALFQISERNCLERCDEWTISSEGAQHL